MWQALQPELAALSSEGKQIIAEQSSHMLQLIQPDLVIESIREMVDAIDEEEFEQLVRKRYRHCGKTGYQVVVAMDGKVIRGTIVTETDDGLCLLAMYLPGEGITLAQVAIPNK